MSISISRDDRGLAYIMTLSFLLLMVAAVYMLHTRLRSGMQLIAGEAFLSSAVDDTHAAMGRALSLLETGTPASPPLDCRLDMPERAGAPSMALHYEVTAGSWTVVATGGTDTSGLPACPAHF